jgi:tRNA pseudouridine38-40 synthase
MMGVLFDVGVGKFNIEFIKKTLVAGNTIKLEHIAPASGLILNDVQL